MADEKVSKDLPLPQAQAIAGTLEDLAVKYKAGADLGFRPISREAVATELNNLAAKVRAGGLPEIETVIGTLDDLAKKYKGAVDMNVRLPAVETIAGTLEDLAKKYHGADFGNPPILKK